MEVTSEMNIYITLRRVPGPEYLRQLNPPYYALALKTKAEDQAPEALITACSLTFCKGMEPGSSSSAFFFSVFPRVATKVT